MKFKLLLEMSLSDAKALFGFSDSYTQDEVNKKYKSLAIKFHPDKGGTVKQMQDLNVAKELLMKNSTNVKTSNGKATNSTNNDDYKFFKDVTIKLCKEYMDNLDPKIYAEYFKSIFKTDFNYEVTKNDDGVIFYGVKVKYHSKDNQKIIIVDIWLRIDDVYSLVSSGKALSSNDMKVYYSTELFIDGKKQKVTNRLYNDFNKKSIFSEPAKILDPKKLSEIAKGNKRKGDVLKKADFEFLFLKKFNGSVKENTYRIQLKDGAYFFIQRIVMMRVPCYEISWFSPPIQLSRMKYKDFADKIVEFQKKYMEKTTKYFYGYETKETLEFFDKYLSIFSTSDVYNYENIFKQMVSEMPSVSEKSNATYYESKKK